jgi:putative flippase GtrA
MSGRSTGAQLWRYAAVGIASNLVLYGAYLLLTRWGMPSKLAMTLLYALGVLQTFVFNKRWSFRSAGHTGPQFRRYCLAYAAGYAFNLSALFLAVDVLGWPHEVVQGILILVTALLLFLLQKFWVFRAPRPPTNAPVPTP